MDTMELTQEWTSPFAGAAVGAGPPARETEGRIDVGGVCGWSGCFAVRRGDDRAGRTVRRPRRSGSPWWTSLPTSASTRRWTAWSTRRRGATCAPRSRLYRRARTPRPWPSTTSRPGSPSGPRSWTGSGAGSKRSTPTGRCPRRRLTALAELDAAGRAGGGRRTGRGDRAVPRRPDAQGGEGRLLAGQGRHLGARRRCCPWAASSGCCAGWCGLCSSGSSTRRSAGCPRRCRDRPAPWPPSSAWARTRRHGGVLARRVLRPGARPAAARADGRPGRGAADRAGGRGLRADVRPAVPPRPGAQHADRPAGHGGARPPAD